jgi:hypothetical protein
VAILDISAIRGIVHKLLKSFDILYVVIKLTDHVVRKYQKISHIFFLLSSVLLRELLVLNDLNIDLSGILKVVKSKLIDLADKSVGSGTSGSDSLPTAVTVNYNILAIRELIASDRSELVVGDANNIIIIIGKLISLYILTGLVIEEVALFLGLNECILNNSRAANKCDSIFNTRDGCVYLGKSIASHVANFDPNTVITINRCSYNFIVLSSSFFYDESIPDSSTS